MKKDINVGILAILVLLAVNIGFALGDTNISKTATGSTPATAVEWVGTGWELFYQGKYNESLAAAEKAISLNSNLDRAWGLKGDSLYNLGENNESLAAYNKALEIYPYYWGAWMGKSGILMKMGRHNESLAAAEKANKIKPNNFASWSGTSYALYDLHRYNESLEAVNQAIELLDSNYADLWLLKGSILYNMGDLDGALIAYGNVIAKQGNESA